MFGLQKDTGSALICALEHLGQNTTIGFRVRIKKILHAVKSHISKHHNVSSHIKMMQQMHIMSDPTCYLFNIAFILGGLCPYLYPLLSND